MGLTKHICIFKGVCLHRPEIETLWPDFEKFEAGETPLQIWSDDGADTMVLFCSREEGEACERVADVALEGTPWSFIRAGNPRFYDLEPDTVHGGAMFPMAMLIEELDEGHSELVLAMLATEGVPQTVIDAVTVGEHLFGRWLYSWYS